MSATSPTATNPDAFIKVLNLGADGSSVTVEISQGFGTEVDWVAVETQDSAGSPSCSPPVDGPVAAGAVVAASTTSSCTDDMSTVTVYAGDSGAGATAGCTTGAGVTSHTFQVPCTCPTVGDVTPLGLVPEAVDDYFTAEKGRVVTGSVLEVNSPVGSDSTDQDSSQDGEINVTPIDVSAPYTTENGGTAVLGVDGSFTYTPDEEFVGTDKFPYVITDSDGDASTATVYITITEPGANPVPTAIDDYFTTDKGVQVSGQVKNPNPPEGSTSTVADSSPDGTINVTPIVTPIATTEGGTAVLDDTGVFTYKPEPNFVGTDSFPYQITDSNGDSATATVYITIVEPTPDTVPLAVDDYFTTDKGVEVTGSVLESNPEGPDSPPDKDSSPDDTMIVSPIDDSTTPIPTSNGGSAVLGPDGAFTYTPDDAFVGVDSFPYKITDSTGDTSTATVYITINEPTPNSEVPTAVDDHFRTPKDEPLTGSVLTSNPPDGSTSTEKDHSPDGTMVVTPTDDITPITTTEGGKVVLSEDGTFTYTPPSTYVGEDSFPYKITDSDGDTDTATVHITVTQPGAGSIPSAIDDYFTTDLGEPVTGDVLESNPPEDSISTDKDSSPDDTIIITPITSLTTENGGTATLGEDGTFTYKPTPTFVGEDSFPYVITDSDGDTSTATVYITINEPVPTAVDDYFYSEKGSPINGDVLQSNPQAGSDSVDVDSSPDGTITVISTPAGTPLSTTGGGSVVLDQSGKFTYTPESTFVGDDSFPYVIEDSNGDKSTATVYITISEPDSVPIAVDDYFTTDKNVPVSGLVLDSNSPDGSSSDKDYSPDGTIVVTVVPKDTPGTTPNGGKYVLDNEGRFTYTPESTFIGDDSFPYVITDSNGDSATATVFITVVEPPAPDTTPTAVDDYFTTEFGEPITDGNVLTSNPPSGTTSLEKDSSPDGVIKVTPQSITTPSGGTVVITEKGNLTYTPASGFIGDESFTYEIRDQNDDADTATVFVTVNPPACPIPMDDSVTTNEDTNTQINVLSNDEGLPGLTLSLVMPQTFTTQSGGSVTIIDAAKGLLGYAPPPNWSGEDSFSYTMTDGYCEKPATVTVTVLPVNDCPIPMDDEVTMEEDGSVTINVLDNDTDADEEDTLTLVSTTDSNVGGTIVLDTNAGTVTYEPPADYHGQDSFVYTVTDGDCVKEGTVTVTVTPVNDCPVPMDTVAQTSEDVPVVIPVLANLVDADGDDLTVTGVTLPSGSGATFILSDDKKKIIYTPSPNWAGIEKITYTVSDGVCENTATVSISVGPVNDCPVAMEDSAETDEDTPVTIDVLANDTDIDGDTLTVVTATPPAVGGTVIIDQNKLVFTPPAGWSGDAILSYTVSDGKGCKVVAKVFVTVNPVNDCPVAMDDTVTTKEDTQVLVKVLDNDSDAEGDLITITSVSETANKGTVILVPSSGAAAKIRYTPPRDFSGEDSFTYTISDGGEGCEDVATVVVTVNPVNDCPLATSDVMNTLEDTPATINVLDNDVDPDGDALTVVKILSGTAIIKDGEVGTVEYTPPKDLNGMGADHFAYVITDGSCEATATVTVNIEPVNDCPIPMEDSSFTNEDTPVDIDVLENDEDVENDQLTLLSASTSAKGGTTSFDGSTGIVTYSPPPNFSGTDTFTYTMTDGDSACVEEGTVSINVVSVNDCPTAMDDAAIVDEDSVITVEVLLNDKDTDNDKLTLVSAVSPTVNGGTVTVDKTAGTITYRPDKDFNGEDVVTYTITDGRGCDDSANVTVTVVPINDCPVTMEDSVETNEDTPVTVFVLDNDSDLDGDTLTLVGAASNPSHGSIVQKADGSFTYTPNSNYHGVDSWVYKVTDGICESTGVVMVRVIGQNDCPIAMDDQFSTPEDTELGGNVLINDSDPDDDNLTVTRFVSDALHGHVLQLKRDGSFIFEPLPNYSGPDSFVYEVTDGQCTVSATVNIQVNEVNDGPTAVDDTASTIDCVAVSGNVLDGSMSAGFVADFDPEGDALVLNLVPSTGPMHGSIRGALADGQLNSDGSFQYKPDCGFIGEDKFVYTVSDGRGGTSNATVTITVSPNPNPPPPEVVVLEDQVPECECGHKTETIEGEGKVTGGGWIYLTEKTYFNAALVCGKNDDLCESYSNTNMNSNLKGKKANYGFNAMYRKGTPYGSTNFDFDGGAFHFHSTTKNTPYKFLEVVDPVHARWMGTGTLATSLNPKTKDYKTGFCFMVAVQDHGEPGADDTWRIRIWTCDDKKALDKTPDEFAAAGDAEGTLVFDTNYAPRSKPAPNTESVRLFPLPSTMEANDSERYRFNGTNVGELDQNGGGNIQIHLKGKKSAALNYLLSHGDDCNCTIDCFEGDGDGFVTGGGWIVLDENAYMKDESDSLVGIKANFGFNAKWQKGNPDGSTNFDIEGNGFHFHSSTGGGVQYKGLEVVCADTPYGSWANTVAARWWGIGKVARTMGNPKTSDWEDGYMYYISVQDYGEPGTVDTWRIRIFDTNGEDILFDSDITKDAIFDNDPLLCECKGCKCDSTKGWEADFTGNWLGGTDASKNGGGNIQTHCKKKYDTSFPICEAATTSPPAQTVPETTSRVIVDPVATTTEDITPLEVPTPPVPMCADMTVVDLTGYGGIPGIGQKGNWKDSAEPNQNFLVPYYSNGNMVKMDFYQVWKEKDIEWMCAVWQQNGEWVGDFIQKAKKDKKCDEKKQVCEVAETKEGIVQTIEAGCVNGQATVYVYVKDKEFDKKSVAPHPSVCAGVKNGKGESSTFGYKATISCGAFGEDDDTPKWVGKRSPEGGERTLDPKDAKDNKAPTSKTYNPCEKCVAEAAAALENSEVPGMSCTVKRKLQLFKFDYWPFKDPLRTDVIIQIKTNFDNKIYNFTHDTTGFPGTLEVSNTDNFMTVPEFYIQDQALWDVIYREQYQLDGMGVDFRFVSKNGAAPWNYCKYSPIAIDLDGSGDVEKINGTFFIDMEGDGDDEELNEWFAPTEGILLKDPPLDGDVSGVQMLGDMGGTYTDGYAKLTKYDTVSKNGTTVPDGVIQGSELEGFHIWIDKNSNAHLDEGELYALSDFNIIALYTAHDKLVSKALLANGTEIMTRDLWFAR